jgi:hypothetical protein
MYLFGLAMRAKLVAPPTRSQMPGKHHAMHAGTPGAAGSKMARRARRGINVRGY